MNVPNEIRKSPESDGENEAVGSRLKEVMAGMITIKAAADTVGVTEKTIQRWIRGATSVDVGAVITICRKVSADPAYVLTGVKQDGVDWGSSLPAVAADQRRLPVYDVYASAGGGAQVFEDKPTGFLHFPSQYADTLGSADSLEIVRVTGDSMEPSFKAGDQVMIDTTAPLRDGVYVIRLDDQILLKRIQLIEPGKLRLISDNHIYPPQEIVYGNLPSAHFEIKGRAVWTGRAL